MGIMMQKLVAIGEYCDCLEDWKKYQIGNESQSQSNLFMSENDSNLDVPIDKVFNHQKIDSGLDKQLQLMHQRLRKRKKLKAEFLKQKEKQHKANQLDQQKKDRQKRQNIERERYIWLRQQELIKEKEIAAEKLRKENQQRKIKANKKNRRIKEKSLQKHDILQVQTQNNTFSTTDQNAIKDIKNQTIPEQNQQNLEDQKQVQEKIGQGQKGKQKSKKSKKNKSEKQKKKKKQSQSSSSSDASESSRQKNQKNIFQQPEYYQEHQKYIQQKDQLKYHQEEVSDLDSALFSHRGEEKAQIQIIDLEKLNKNQLKNEISQLVIRKLRERQDDTQFSQTVPLHPAIQSHRISNAKNYESRKQQLQFLGKDDGFGSDVVEFTEAGMHSTIIQKESNNYFLDDDDKQEYIKEMLR